MKKRLKETEDLIKEKIPMTVNTAFQLISYENDELKLLCPLKQNENHHGTIFGGSLAMASIISGYSLTFMALEDRLGKDWDDIYQLVIKDFACDYKRPVHSDTICISRPESDVFEFVETLMRMGKARLKVKTIISDVEERLVCEATYVAYKKG